MSFHHHKFGKCCPPKHHICCPPKHDKCCPPEHDFCPPKYECAPVCNPRPKCVKKCIGTFSTKFKIYETCCQEICKVCCRCGHEFPHHHPKCPKCGTPAHMFAMDAPSSDPHWSWGSRGRFRRQRFFPFFSPFFFPF